jgi:hypothetical protein
MLNVCGAARSYAGQMDRLTTRIGVTLGALALGVGAAELLGANSLGIAFGFGQIAFALTLGFVLLRA